MTADPSPKSDPSLEAEPRRGRVRRWLVRATLALGLVVGVGGLFEVTIWTAPAHMVFNALPALDEREAWQAEEPTLVVLQHGLASSPWTLWRLERTLEANGYAVLNPSYPSLDGGLEDFAASLHEKIERACAERAASGEPAFERFCFVGHSMGGLVIRSYLAREDSREAHRSVFLGTPHRGSAMAKAWIDRWWFQLLLSGKGATRQLVPGDPIYDRLRGVDAGQVGTLVGSVDTDGAEVIPGPDDGRIGVDEGQLPAAADSAVLPMGHFSLSFDRRMIEPVMRFLRSGRFDGQG
ncbi:MAG: alpha/beta fold hydrolase [Planctomycetota bacterium]